MVAHLDRPFYLAPGAIPPVTQGFAHLWSGVEPAGYLYPDNSIAYTDGPGAVAGCFHNGVDYGLDCGTPLRSPAAGTVISAGWDDTGFGNCVVLEHAHLGIKTLCGHLSRIDVSQGQFLTADHPIGLSGTTGNSTGCHLHFSVIRLADEHYVDPAPYINAASTPPADAVHYAHFTVTTDRDGNPVNLFGGPSGKLNWIQSIANGTKLDANAWMHGEPKWDDSVGAWDRRWYHLADGSGWVASARVAGNAPNSKP